MTARLPHGAKVVLDRAYEAFNHPASAPDPVHLVRRYSSSQDVEVAAFCAAALAFGRVASVVRVIDDLFGALGPEPAAFIRTFNPKRDGRTVRLLQHRWIRGSDMVQLLVIVKHMLEVSGSIEQFFLEGYDPDHEDIGPALDHFCERARSVRVQTTGRVASRSSGIEYCFPRPRSGSACKRLNLFLRWMVRRDRIDFGIWSQVDPSKLVIPLDVHVVRVGQCLGLTTYRSPGWPMARQMTRALRQLDARDPVKYDFALCHLGMRKECGFKTEAGDARCPLRGVCQPNGRKRLRPRRPSGPM